ncbi:hypothetical protein [Rossellomorea aquimaris]|uniref:hypothetical protein n=1 Tax=Rossellomorea aquimaris TaxID=189382 RepID=UPI000B0B0240|nr:hypothetical protein [Rossellomorea aquimaris]
MMVGIVIISLFILLIIAEESIYYYLRKKVIAGQEVKEQGKVKSIYQKVKLKILAS